MLKITERLSLAESEIEISAMRSQGAGGQNVNKTSSAIHLRFNVAASSLPAHYKEQLLALRDHRVTDDGWVVIKAQQHRSQPMNRAEALERLAELIRAAGVVRITRKATKPTRGSKRRRLEGKIHRGRIKALRQGKENERP